jgi:hypothetical protein
MIRRLSRHPRTLPLAAAVAAAVATQAEPAAACGGLFCSAASPVNQTAERIIFASDGAGTITCAIEIQYEGPAERFSWVLPVPGVPEVGVSSNAAFNRLQQASNPLYQLQTVLGAGCDGLARSGNLASGDSIPGAGGASAGENDVRVVASGTVGPFDYEVIEVKPGLPDPADVAVEWFEENGYDMPPNGRDTLRPYLADGQNLIGFRLNKNATAGSIRPVILRYRSDRAIIPIRPTAVAATEDMGVLVWVLGDARAVPVNYRTLELNDSLIDWFNPGPTYNDVVIAAANEAGGHGFVTEQSGAAGGFAETIWPSWEQQQVDSLAWSNGSIPSLLTETTQSVGFLDGFPDVLRETVTLRESWTAEAFIDCPWCYYEEVGIDPYGMSPAPGSDPSLETDLVAFRASLEQLVIGPMEDTRRLFETHGHVTRMYTTLSADEMTVDPAFDFNPELEDVDNLHVATQTLTCMDGDPFGGGDNPWTIELPSGLVVSGSGQEWPYRVGEELPANLRILQHTTSGSGEVIEDNRESIRSALGNDAGGCGCRAAGRGASGSGWLTAAALGLAGLGLRRARKGVAPTR